MADTVTTIRGRDTEVTYVSSELNAIYEAKDQAIAASIAAEAALGAGRGIYDYPYTFTSAGYSFTIPLANSDDAVEAIFLDGQKQNRDTWEAVNGVVTFSEQQPAGRTVSALLSKRVPSGTVNAADITDSVSMGRNILTGALAPQLSFSSYATWLDYAEDHTPPVGTVASADGLQWEFMGAAHTGGVTGAPAWEPVGIRRPGHYGATEDGTTNDVTALAAAEAAGYPVWIERPVNTNRTNFNSFPGTYLSPNGAQLNSAGGKLPPNYAKADVAPASVGSAGSFLTAFNGDLSKSLWVAGQNLRNNALGAPTSGYLFTPELSLEYVYTYMASGYNNATASDDGRTAYVQKQGTIYHAGQGDAIVNHSKVIVTTTKAGATHFLAHPAGVLYGGSVQSAADYTNLTVGEITLTDAGYDARGTGFVFNFFRDNDTAGHQNFWNGLRLQSKGTKDVDAGYQVVGKFKVGLDTSTAIISGAAVAMAADQRIELNATPLTDAAGIKQYASTLPGWDWGYNSAASAQEWRASGTARMRLSATGLSVLGTGSSLTVSGTNGLVVNGGAATFSGGAVTISGGNLALTGRDITRDGSKVVGARDTGWTAMTGTTNKATVYDTSTVTLAQLAARVASLQAALTTHGLIGA